MPGQQNSVILKAIMAAVMALVVLLAGWTMMLNSTQGEDGKDIATNTADISNVKDDIREIKTDQRRILDKIDKIDAKLPNP